MKRIIFILPVLICSAAVFAEDTIQGMYSYTFGDSESLVEAKQTCKNLALRDALESYYLFVESVTDVENFQLKNDLIKSITAGSLRNVAVVDQTEEGRTITMTVTARVDPKEIQAQIDKAVQSQQVSGPVSEETSPPAVDDESFFTNMDRYESRLMQAETGFDTQDSRKLITLFQEANGYLLNHRPDPNSPFQKAVYHCIQLRTDLLREFARLKYFQNERKRTESQNQRKVVSAQSEKLRKAVLALQSLKNLSEKQESVQKSWIAKCQRTLAFVEKQKGSRPLSR